MANETVLDVLKAMRKASAREIAARMEIELTDALEMLREQKGLGRVKFKGGGWSLGGYKEPEASEKEMPNEPVIRTGSDVEGDKESGRTTSSTRALVESIPSFTESHPGDLLIPAPVEIARMIRKAKHNLRELEQIRTLSISLKRYRKTLVGMAEIKREG